MILDHEAQVTDAVRAAMGRTANVRLREVMDAFVRHAHAFIREVKPSEDEFYDGLMWIASLGHHTNATNNEVVLAADVLGISTLVDLLNNTASSGETMSALLGPFYRANAPICAKVPPRQAGIISSIRKAKRSRRTATCTRRWTCWPSK